MFHREKPGFRGECNLFQIAHVWNRTSDLLPVLIPTVLWPCRRMMPLRKPLSSWDLLFVCRSRNFLWYLGIYWALNQSVGSGWSCRRPLTEGEWLLHKLSITNLSLKLKFSKVWLMLQMENSRPWHLMKCIVKTQMH